MGAHILRIEKRGCGRYSGRVDGAVGFTAPVDGSGRSVFRHSAAFVFAVSDFFAASVRPKPAVQGILSEAEHLVADPNERDRPQPDTISDERN